VVEGKPFPTLYWLTCPFLSREIGHLEAAGWVKQLEARMAEEPELRSAMHEAHQRTWSRRDQLLSSEEKAALAADGTLVGLEGRGIGGISDWDRLKCLHLHAAHALADENPTGSIVLRMLPALEVQSLEVVCLRIRVNSWRLVHVIDPHEDRIRCREPTWISDSYGDRDCLSFALSRRRRCENGGG